MIQVGLLGWTTTSFGAMKDVDPYKQIIDANWYKCESPTTSTFLVLSKNSSMACFGASQHTFRVPQRSQDVLGKKTQWHEVNILMFS